MILCCFSVSVVGFCSCVGEWFFGLVVVVVFGFLVGVVSVWVFCVFLEVYIMG